VRPFKIIIVVAAVAACAGGAWVFFGQRGLAEKNAASRAHDFFKPPQDYKTTGGQQMKPRW
jgi:Ti type entry exclusion protein TrbK